MQTDALDLVECQACKAKFAPHLESCPGCGSQGVRVPFDRYNVFASHSTPSLYEEIHRSRYSTLAPRSGAGGSHTPQPEIVNSPDLSPASGSGGKFAYSSEETGEGVSP